MPSCCRTWLFLQFSSKSSLLCSNIIIVLLGDGDSSNNVKEIAIQKCPASNKILARRRSTSDDALYLVSYDLENFNSSSKASRFFVLWSASQPLSRNYVINQEKFSNVDMASVACWIYFLNLRFLIDTTFFFFKL